MTQRTRWTLSQEAFEKLLETLDRDRDRAGEKYQTIRASLVRMFECRGCRAADQLADETMDRVSRRIEGGEEIRGANPAAYFYGVGRHVLQEYFTHLRRNDLALENRAPSPASAADEREALQGRLECLERCVSKLSPDNREIILGYHSREKGEKIASRQALAKARAISLETLRMRAHRIRRVLEACVNDCLKRRSDLRIAPGESQ